ncbi:membrane protein [Rhizocola hellebori]|uniref:Membrane protein n=1 Tax=Rhizocola hellebori TaxID=1392758 RepID=A0A8J3Q2L5_9ACTN|nr:DUF2306 domain-containing protein [Rhizocola hellebori]GIH02506.1 membrane protein [Rhizocola hellebori]
MTKSTARRDWLIIIGLLLLALVPATAGAFRVTELSTGPELTPDNARFVSEPIPVVVHIVGAVLLSVLSPFQFMSGLRRRRLRWHRLAGWIIIPSGLAAALSGLWMTVFYDLPAFDGAAVNAMRLVVGSVMAAAFVLGFAAIRRGDIARHSAWMIRGYALGMGAGTQALTHLPLLFTGTPGLTARAIAMGAGWLINIVVAEWVIRTKLPRPKRTTPAEAVVNGLAHR